MGESESDKRIFNILFNEDEVTWQSIIYDLLKKEEINPWDVDITLLASKFLNMLKKLKEMDFRISGKVLLAASMLLKIKSTRLMGNDLTNFENLIKEPDQEEENLEEYVEEGGDLDEQLENLENKKNENDNKIRPKTPLPRERKVNIFDLVEALEKALETKRKNVIRENPAPKVEKPKKTRDITDIIRDIHSQIKEIFMKNNKDQVEFSELAKSDKKSDKVMTFIPLLHLSNEQKVELKQDKHFSPIFVKLLKKE